jgi:hypothetical protein
MYPRGNIIDLLLDGVGATGPNGGALGEYTPARGGGIPRKRKHMADAPVQGPVSVFQ